MIFINLLPNIKIEFLKMQRIRRILMSIAIIIFPACIILCGWVYYQANYVNADKITELIKENDGLAASVSEQITVLIENEEGIKVEAKEDISDILNVRRKLDALEALHIGKTEVHRLFSFSDLKYLDNIMYEELNGDATIYNEVNFDFNNNTFSIKGQVPSLTHYRNFKNYLTYLGLKEGCTEDNVNTRFYPFNITFPQESSISARGVGSYEITGSFEPILFESLEKIQKNNPGEEFKNYDINKELRLVGAVGFFDQVKNESQNLCIKRVEG